MLAENRKHDYITCALLLVLAALHLIPTLCEPFREILKLAPWQPGTSAYLTQPKKNKLKKKFNNNMK